MEKCDVEKGNLTKNLYQERDPRNNIHSGESRALYWYRYRETYNLLREYLKFGEKIQTPLQLRGALSKDIFLLKYITDYQLNMIDIPIVVVGNNLLKPFDFDIKKKDRNVINGFNYPGISATIAFSDNLAETCGGIFDRDCRRQDRMYIASVGQIEECNYSVYYLPFENQPLHVRLVHNIHEINIEEHLPPFKDRELLAMTFSENKIKG